MLNTKTVANDTLQALLDNKEEIKGFDQAFMTVDALSRRLYLGAISEEVGDSIDGFIRFWNQVDDENEVPVEEREPIKLFINSIGGDIYATFTMIDSIKQSKTPVWTINTGAAWSGGFFTFIAGHRRIAYPHSSFLFHEGSAANGGDAGKFRNFAAFYEKILGELKKHTLEYTKISEEEYDKHVKDDWWMLVDDALELGVCDEISKEHL